MSLHRESEKAYSQGPRTRKGGERGPMVAREGEVSLVYLRSVQITGAKGVRCRKKLAGELERARNQNGGIQQERVWEKRKYCGRKNTPVDRSDEETLKTQVEGHWRRPRDTHSRSMGTGFGNGKEESYRGPTTGPKRNSERAADTSHRGE